MALPKVSTPTYELTIPSSGEKVSYRPFLVKEEKTLLMAMESKDTAAMTKAMQDIITSCTDGEVKPKDLAPYDLEFFFLQLRGRSIGEIIEVKAPRPPNFEACCKEATEEDVCKLSINIDDIKVDTSKIKPSEIIIMLQLEVAQRMIAKPGNMSLLSVFTQIFGNPTIIAKVKPTSFFPRPKVFSAIVRIEVFQKPLISQKKQLSFFNFLKIKIINTMMLNLFNPFIF